MNTADTIYELVKTLPEEQASLVLIFTQFIQQQSTEVSTQMMPKGTLTGLRGIAKPHGRMLSDDGVAEDYADYLIQKYQ